MLDLSEDLAEGFENDYYLFLVLLEVEICHVLAQYFSHKYADVDDVLVESALVHEGHHLGARKLDIKEVQMW